MNSDYFPKTSRWLIPQAAIDLSREEMAKDGLLGHEGTSLWLGTKEKEEARLTHIVFLRGSGIRKSSLNIQIDPSLMREVHERAEAAGVILIGQIHSHSERYGVDLSPTDHKYGIRVPYFLSVVCPNYAQTKSTTIMDCGVHVFLPSRGFIRLSQQEIPKNILVLTNQGVESLTVGGI